MVVGSLFGILAEAFPQLIATLVGGFLTFIVAMNKLQSNRSLTIDDWYAKALLLTDQVQDAGPESFGSRPERSISHERFERLSERLDRHVAEAPGGVDRRIAHNLDDLTKLCYRVSHCDPVDSDEFRGAIEDAISKSNSLEGEIEDMLN